MARFKLRKYYLDCVTPEGKGIIVYWARLQWSIFRLDYSARIEFSSDGSGHSSRTSLARSPEPVVTKDEISVSLPKLGLAGSWMRGSRSIRQQLLSGSDGAIDWTCLTPNARASVKLDDGIYEGLGYAELIELSISPGKLGIEELRWGRFISETVDLVWIDWKGPNARQFVYRNGQGIEARVDETGLFSSEGTLQFTDPKTLRHDSIGRSLSIPFLRPVLQLLHLDLDERKYVSKARWTDNDGSIEGWAIYEVVRWPK